MATLVDLLPSWWDVVEVWKAHTAATDGVAAVQHVFVLQSADLPPLIAKQMSQLNWLQHWLTRMQTKPARRTAL